MVCAGHKTRCLRIGVQTRNMCVLDRARQISQHEKNDLPWSKRHIPSAGGESSYEVGGLLFWKKRNKNESKDNITWQSKHAMALLVYFFYCMLRNYGWRQRIKLLLLLGCLAHMRANLKLANFVTPLWRLKLPGRIRDLLNKWWKHFPNPKKIGKVLKWGGNPQISSVWRPLRVALSPQMLVCWYNSLFTGWTHKTLFVILFCSHIHIANPP